MWSFSEVIDGMAEACRVFDTPVVSGNVSFYNETEGRGILPTPVIGMVGLIEDVRRVVQQGFKSAGDVVALLGVTNDDLALSEYAVSVAGHPVADLIANGVVPQIDLTREHAIQAACLEAAEEGLLQSAHDCSDGGLAVALAECCFSSLNRTAIGAILNLQTKLALNSELFGESPSRILVSFDASHRDTMEAIAARQNAALTVLGKTGGDKLRIEVNGEAAIDSLVSDLEHVWRNSLPQKLQAQAMAAGME